MSSESKRVKLLVLIELFLGVALIGAAIALVVMGLAPKKLAAVMGGEGLATVFFGARGALIANVPARIGKLATLALIIAFVQIACIVAVILIPGAENAKDNIPYIVASAIPALLSCIIWILSRGMAKRAER